MASVAAPLVELNELLNWKKEDITVELQKALDKICDIHLQDPGARPQTLLCHDMKGGYIEDRFLEGCSDNEAYRFVHWHSIDWFVYFSHSFITIPPPGWTAAAHKNGVPMLGTLITEGPPGEQICKELFSSLRTVEQSVLRLVSIARHHKLHGWLINIENKIDPVAIGLVILFLQKLTAAMKTVTSCSRVVWYDSVTHEGKLRWQDELNGQNSCFYEACDAIFLNYSWSVEQLRASRQYARALPRRAMPFISADLPGGDGGRDGGDAGSLDGNRDGGGHQRDVEPVTPRVLRSRSRKEATQPGASHQQDGTNPQHLGPPHTSVGDALSSHSPGEETKVFVGVDVFGRNFYEGGGFNCYKALEVIRALDLSAAIFAPGWTHEMLGRADFPYNDAKFWELLAPHLRESGPSHWPLTSCFSDGCGRALYHDGQVVDASPWYNLSLQSLLPNVTLSSSSSSSSSSNQAAQYDHSEAYMAGSCLLLRNSSAHLAAFPLWRNCRLDVTSTTPLHLHLVYRWQQQPQPPPGVPCVRLSSAEHSLNIDMSGDSSSSPPKDAPELLRNGWLVRRWRCATYDGTVRTIFVTLPPHSALKLGLVDLTPL